MRHVVTTTLASAAVAAWSALAFAQALPPAQLDPAPPTQSAPTPLPAQSVAPAPPPAAAVPAAPTRQMTVSDLTDKDLEGPNANEVGDIERVVEANADKKQHLVISRGGFLGMFETEVAIPVENVAVQGDRIVLRNMTPEQIKTLPAFDKAGFRELESSATVTLTEVR
jgi:sporulation protein YlmC with PRC-barrel domain